jgi:flagellar export protein FliJ
MNDTPRLRENMEKLLRIARGEADALRADLADIERARAAAKTSLTSLDEKIRTEDVAGADHGDLARFLEGTRERRLNLRNTVATLDRAEENARLDLEAAFIEIKKLEHVLDASDAASRRASVKRDASAMQEIASIMARRHAG